MTVALLDERATLRPDPVMGFNRRKMEDRRREAAEKEAASRRATPKYLRMPSA